MQELLVRFYAWLLYRLPAGFRDEFAGEMEQVFARRILEVELRGRWSLLRQFVLELLALPGLWLLAYQRQRRVLKMTGSIVPELPDRQASWAAAFVAVFPLVGYIGLVLLADPLRHLMPVVGLTALFDFLWVNVIRAGPMPMIFYLLLLAGLLLAWLKGFPCWSFTYLSWLVIFLISGMGIIPVFTSPYLQQIGLTGFKDPFLRRIWIPLILTLLLALLFDHSSKPLTSLWLGLRKDWTLASFALFGILEFMVLTFFDEVPGPQTALVFWQLVVVALLAVGAVGYIRARVKVGRLAALLGSAALSIALSASVTAYHWQNYPKSYGPVIEGSSTLLSGLLFLIVVILFLLAPALLSAAMNRLFTSRPAA